jgi:hypothetical protein
MRPTQARAILCLALWGAPSAHAVTPFLLKEALGDSPGGAPVPCVATANINGNCANYRWYNFCSGYIWIYAFAEPGAEIGQSFKESEGLSCIHQLRFVKRTITYFRNTVPNYGQTVDIRVNRDSDADGCVEDSEPIIAQHVNLDPALRWNCSNFGDELPAGTTALIVSAVLNGTMAPSIATDGGIAPGPPHQTQCPLPVPHTFYYGVGRTACVPFVGPLGNFDNWPVWLVMDVPIIDAIETTTWGRIKGLYQ